MVKINSSLFLQGIESLRHLLYRNENEPLSTVSSPSFLEKYLSMMCKELEPKRDGYMAHLLSLHSIRGWYLCGCHSPSLSLCAI